MRKFSWFILIVNVLFLVWIIAGASSGGSATDCGTLTAQACEDARTVGKGIGVVFLVVLWAVVDVILLVLWLVTKPKEKPQVIYVDRPAVQGEGK